jgi:hypothetical protein
MRSVRAGASGSLHEPTSGRPPAREAIFSPPLAASRSTALTAQGGRSRAYRRRKDAAGKEIAVLLAPSPIRYANRGGSGGEARHSSDGPAEFNSTLDGRTAVLATVGLAHHDARRRPNRSRPVHRNLGLGRWVCP